jgi:lysophospholipase L1-like esterase
MKLERGSKFIFIGDSITDCGRTHPFGEAPHGLGNGYVSLVDAMLQSAYPHLQVQTINVGVGGNTVRDLDGRWSRDVTALKPDWVSMMIGVNDVWRQFDRPHHHEIHVSLQEYKDTLENLVSQTRDIVRGLVVMSPFFVEPNTDEPMRKLTDDYGAAAKQVAEQYDAIFVDTQRAFDKVLEYYHPTYLSADRVHPTLVGHMVVARALMHALES